MEFDQSSLDQLLSQLLELKQHGDGVEWESVLSAGALQILELKRVHRELVERTEALREETSAAKTLLDTSSLQLQNLLYEQQHYEKEIASCRAFKSAYSEQQLELVPEDMFLSLKMVHQQGLASDDPHQRMLNRLAHELTWRQQTVKELDGLKAQRDALAAEVAAKRGGVAGLEAEVGRLRSAAQNVAQQYGLAGAGGAAAEQPSAAEAAGQAAAGAAGTAVPAAAPGGGTG